MRHLFLTAVVSAFGAFSVWAAALPALRSTGQEYINTGVKDANARMVVKFRFTDTTTEGAMGRWKDKSPSFCFSRQFESKTDSVAVNRERFQMIVNDTSANAVYTPYVAKNTDWHVLDLSNSAFLLDGVEIDKSGVSGSLTKNPDSELRLFARQDNNSVGSFMKCDIASCQIYSGSELIRDLVPCIKDASTVCMTNRAYAAGNAAHGTAYYLNGSGKGAFTLVDGPVSDGITVVGNPIAVATPSPAYGAQAGLTVGDSYTWTCPADYTNDAQTVAYHCTGWTLWTTNGTMYANEPGKETTCTFEYDDDLAGAVLTWKWSVKNKLELSVEGQGALSEETQWLAEDASITIETTPASGWKFYRWTGTGANAANRYRTAPTLKMNTPKTLAAHFYELATAAKVDLYVSVDGAGDFSGRDWENASKNLTTAYATCAANPVGGTVHLAGGIYRSTAWSATKGNFTANAAVLPAPNVTLIGSDDGENPTILTGDRGLNDTWDFDKSSQWADGKLVLPPLGTATLPVTSSDDANFVNSSERAENCRFENLTIHGLTGTGVALYYATNAVFANCQFIGIGTTSAHPRLCCLDARCAPVTVTNCTFVGTVSALHFEVNAATTMTVVDCLIRSGVNWGAYCGTWPPAINSGNGVTLKLIGTTVRDTEASNPTLWSASGSSLNCRDCIFQNCQSYNNSSAGAAVFSEGGGTFVGCLFLTNYLSTTTTGYYASPCISGDGSYALVDCYFRGNKLVKTNGASNADASVLSTKSFNTYTLVNCTAEDNCVTSSAGKAANACTIGGWRPQQFAMANCVFRNNRNIDAKGTRGPEFRSIRTYDNTSDSPMFVNSIVRNSDANFVLFPYTKDSDAHRRFGVAACDMQGYVAPTTGATGNGFSYAPIVDVDPVFADESVVVGSRGARPLTKGSPREISRKAVKVCKATNGSFYFLDTHVTPNVWRKIAIANASVSKVSLANGEAIGLTPDMAAYPDVFGNVRYAHASMGPVDAPSLGLSVQVR